MSGFDSLNLGNQLCFPLYVVSKEIVRRYTPYLKDIDLTYTQYIAMMVIWEERKVSVKHLGERLHLDSGTLTPLLRKLESKGLVTRTRSAEDERRLDVCITDKGMALREKALAVPEAMGKCLKISKDDAQQLADLLHKIMTMLEA